MKWHFLHLEDYLHFYFSGETQSLTPDEETKKPLRENLVQAKMFEVLRFVFRLERSV